MAAMPIKSDTIWPTGIIDQAGVDAPFRFPGLYGAGDHPVVAEDQPVLVADVLGHSLDARGGGRTENVREVVH